MGRFTDDQGGYFTLEAAMVVPIVLFCVLSVFLFGIYFYDLAAAKSCLLREMAQLSDTIKTEASPESGQLSEKRLLSRSLSYLLQSSYPKYAAAGKRKIQNDLGEKLILSKASQISVTAGQQKIIGEIRLSFYVPFPLIRELTGKIWKNKLTVAIENGNNAEQMRRWDSLE